MMEQTVSDVENFTKNVTFGGGSSDLEAGIQFIYDRSDHFWK